MPGGRRWANTRGRPLWWHGRFRSIGYRLTVPRHAILNILSTEKGHLSAEDIYLGVHKIYPSVGLTTVYRTLDLLTQIGLVYKFDFGDGCSRYELSAGPNTKHHHHLICSNCGRVIDYEELINEESKLLKKTEEALSKKYKFKINGKQIQFSGLCDKCQKGGD